jgi:hypothetical protein
LAPAIVRCMAVRHGAFVRRLPSYHGSAAQWLAYAFPCQRFAEAHGHLRMTRGRCGSLLVHRKGLATLYSLPVSRRFAYAVRSPIHAQAVAAAEHPHGRRAGEIVRRRQMILRPPKAAFRSNFRRPPLHISWCAVHECPDWEPGALLRHSSRKRPSASLCSTRRSRVAKSCPASEQIFQELGIYTSGVCARRACHRRRRLARGHKAWSRAGACRACPRRSRRTMAGCRASARRSACSPSASPRCPGIGLSRSDETVAATTARARP